MNLSSANAAALLEVMDKEPGILWWCSACVVLGLAGLFICRRFRRAVFVIVPLYLALGWLATDDIRDPYVGPAIREEAGISYFAFAFLTIFIACAMPIVGYSLYGRSHEPKQ